VFDGVLMWFYCTVFAKPSYCSCFNWSFTSVISCFFNEC